MAHNWQHVQQIVHQTEEGVIDEQLLLAECPAAPSEAALAKSRHGPAAQPGLDGAGLGPKSQLPSGDPGHRPAPAWAAREPDPTPAPLVDRPCSRLGALLATAVHA